MTLLCLFVAVAQDCDPPEPKSTSASLQDVRDTVAELREEVDAQRAIQDEILELLEHVRPVRKEDPPAPPPKDRLAVAPEPR